ncbi:ALF repeat-containing protein, partial [Streptomyces sp. SID8499]|uniref:ALF repeat-containing protein n=1 Tax=Streptomyces sp. SID8499 TaxID=2706106 RepID=UPI0013C8A32C
SASAQTASAASGVAQAEAAEAQRQAQIASTNAALATSAADKSQALASAAASAARTARDAANSAADHAEAAADAADWAAKYAGQALDYANKSKTYADAATTAANTATDAVEQAVAVEAAARQAEWDALDREQTQAMDECRRLAEIDAQQGAALRTQRTQQQQTAEATRNLVAQAEAALSSGDLDQATSLGRKAAVALLDSSGSWTREAARFALSGADSDVHNWVDVGRRLAEELDDREAVLTVAQTGTAAISDAAATVLESDETGAAATFLASGIIDSAAQDNSRAIARVLAASPGKRVAQAANDALDSNTSKALFDFFNEHFGNAQMQDDALATAALLNTGGPYTKAYAQAAMEGPAWVRRHFLATVQHQAAQLDYDSAAHIAAMQGAIAAATKIAHKAQEDAALAQQKAALARNAAADADKYKDQAAQAADDAETSAKQADDLADSAEQSAQSAQAAADRAKAAAASARTAARTANYSANRAMTAARSAVSSAASAQASAAAAR